MSLKVLVDLLSLIFQMSDCYAKELERLKMPCESKEEKYECCGQTFNTKEEMEAHKESHKKSSCCK